MGQIPPEPAPSASDPPGDDTGAMWSGARAVIVIWVFAATWVAVALLWTPTMPAGDENRPVEFPTVPVIVQAEPRSDSEPVPPQLAAEPSPVPDSRQALNVPRAAPDANQLPSHLPLLAEAPRATPREPEARPEVRPNCSLRTRRPRLAHLSPQRLIDGRNSNFPPSPRALTSSTSSVSPPPTLFRPRQGLPAHRGTHSRMRKHGFTNGSNASGTRPRMVLGSNGRNIAQAARSGILCSRSRPASRKSTYSKTCSPPSGRGSSGPLSGQVLS